MTPPRFQFTIRGMLWATFWAALTMAAWLNVGPAWKYDNHGSANLLVPVLATFSIAGPFVTIAALFDRAWIGFIVGSVAAILALLVAIAMGW